MKSSSEIWKETKASLKKDFWPSLGLTALPVFGFILVLFLGPATSYLSLALCPLLVPFLYNAYRYQWAKKDSVSEKPSFSYNNYYSRPGARGCFGLLFSFLWFLIVSSVMETILTALLLFPLMRAYGFGAEAEKISSFFEINGDLNGLIEYLGTEEAAVALSAPMAVITGISILVAYMIFFVMAERARFSYILMTRILPDCENNLVGGQVRALGRSFLYGFFWRELAEKLKILWPFLLSALIVYVGTMIGFSYLYTPVPTLMAALPVIFAGIVMIPCFLIDAASDVALADSMLSEIKSRSLPQKVDSVFATFRNPAYVHTDAKAGQTPFQTAIAAAQADDDSVFDAAGFYSPDNKSAKKAEEKKESDLPSHGFLDFSDDRKDGSDEK